MIDPSQVTLLDQQVSLQVFNHQIRAWNVPLPAQQLISDHTRFPVQALNHIGPVSELWRPPGSEQGSAPGDGWVRLSSWPQSGPGFVPTGLLSICEWALTSLGIPFVVQDERRRPDAGCPDFGPIPLRDYQQAAVDAALRHGRGVVVMPPRGGKTRVGIEVVRSLWLPTLWIAPTKNIVEQTVRAFDATCGPNFAKALVGSDWQALGAPRVFVCTYATALMLTQEFFRKIEHLVCDEVHHAGSVSIRNILFRCQHVFHRFGLTGTFFRSGTDDLALFAHFTAPPIFQITTQELVQLGFLVPSAIALLPVEGKPVKARKGTWMAGGAGDVGVANHPYRNQLAAWAAATLHTSGKRVLVLVATKAQGNEIVRMLDEYVPAGRGSTLKRVEFVSTEKHPAQCRKILDDFSSKGTVEILVGTSMVGEGTDLPVADALVYAPGGRAEVTHTQALYRVATAAEGKKRAIIVDFSDRHHRTLMEHSIARAETYAGEPTAQLFALGTAAEFPAWLAWLATT